MTTDELMAVFQALPAEQQAEFLKAAGQVQVAPTQYPDSQAVFNTVAEHLLRQGRKSLDNFACAYRGENGAKCAVGVVIPDTLYEPEIEGLALRLLLNT